MSNGEVMGSRLALPATAEVPLDLGGFMLVHQRQHGGIFFTRLYWIEPTSPRTSCQLCFHTPPEGQNPKWKPTQSLVVLSSSLLAESPLFVGYLRSMLYFSLSGLLALDFCLTDLLLSSWRRRGGATHTSCSRSRVRIVYCEDENNTFKKLQVRRNIDVGFQPQLVLPLC